MNLQHRIDLMVRLGEYILANETSPEATDWEAAKQKAGIENGWFIPAFTNHAANNIARAFLQRDKLEKWAEVYTVPHQNLQPLSVGIVMAGNIPLVGFHDFLTVFISGHHAIIKPSARDQVLIRHLAGKMAEWESAVNTHISFAGMLKGCDAYIATGSNNSSRYFDYYFAKYPHIIRRNRTSVALLTGKETLAELEKLADDVFLYFGLGCRNVTKLFVPAGYDFVPLLSAFKKYNHLADHHKYKNNYDYNLALHLLNKVEYMTNGALLLVEESSLFSPISQLNFEYYTDENKLTASLSSHPDLQCIVGKDFVPFGQSQCPELTDYADGVDTLAFLRNLSGHRQ